MGVRSPVGLARLRARLPRGGALSETAWASRHRGISAVAWWHVPVLLLLALMQHRGLDHAVADGAIPAALAWASRWPGATQRVQSSAVTLSLFSSAAVLIHLSGGLIELHFHFFVMVAVIALYQSWTPFLLGLSFVVAHHAVMGTLMPAMVYNHPAALAHPELFALMHGSFVLAESVACVMYWRVTEEALDAERAERRNAERMNVALTAANTQISDLVAMMSHDLRAPVTVINGYADTALDSWTTLDDDTRLRFMSKVGMAGHSLQQMLEDTLMVSTLDAQALEPRPAALRLDDAVRSLIAVLSDPLANVELDELERVTVLVDKGHFTQIFSNLVTNAAKYGSAPYRVSARHCDDIVELSVSDSGSGVSTEFASRLFDRFTRSEEVRRGDQRGTGLGLYIVKMLAEANGGGVDYRTTPGGGATFVVRLPRALRVAPILVGAAQPEPGLHPRASVI